MQHEKELESSIADIRNEEAQRGGIRKRETPPNAGAKRPRGHLVQLNRLILI